MVSSNTAPHKKILIINGHPNAGSFCGSKPVRVMALAAIRDADEKQRKTWLDQVAKQAQKNCFDKF